MEGPNSFGLCQEVALLIAPLAWMARHLLCHYKNGMSRLTVKVICWTIFGYIPSTVSFCHTV